ncbi:MAG: prepilin-type N-terminal cleavage/methylation domain-containing protein [Oculatellaceae cyanobacterium Prado106]|nr:prepilin-type N-terminal cleavage/methylation domain-containing protein [Oculatellaceae cyanobacterium Prado106]
MISPRSNGSLWLLIWKMAIAPCLPRFPRQSLKIIPGVPGQRFQRGLATHQGFTLLELLVVVTIVGLLSAMAVPSYLRQANRSREAEARTYVAAINRGQQAFFNEHLRFGTLEELELVLSESRQYLYVSQPMGSGEGVTADTTATPKSGVAKGFAGQVWLAPLADGSVTSRAVVCEGSEGNVPVIVNNACP